MPSNTTLLMHSALANWNMCDVSVHTLLPLLRIVFTDIEPSIRLEWLVVRIRPGFILVLKDETIDDFTQSVIRIIAGARGELSLASSAHGRSRQELALYNR